MTSGTRMFCRKVIAQSREPQKRSYPPQSEAYRSTAHSLTHQAQPVVALHFAPRTSRTYPPPSTSQEREREREKRRLCSDTLAGPHVMPERDTRTGRRDAGSCSLAVVGHAAPEYEGCRSQSQSQASACPVNAMVSRC
jgi:hypothetical protein